MVPNKIPEVRFAVIGESGCGKTTLLASYYGTLAGGAFEKDHHYSIVAEDIAQGNELAYKFLGLREGRFPVPDRLLNHYKFSLSLNGLPRPVLRIHWFDYPGGWLTAHGETQEQEVERRGAILQLLSCDVGFLMFDGSRVRDNEDGAKYMVRFLNQFRNTVKLHRQTLAEMGKSFDDYPKEWVFVLSKADLFPDEYSAKEFQEAISLNAAGSVDELRSLFPGGSGIGTRFLLLSSVKAEGNRIVDPTTSLGMNLVAPLAFLSSLRKIKGFPPVAIKMLDWIASGLMSLEEILPILLEIASMLPGGGLLKMKKARILLDWLGRLLKRMKRRPGDIKMVTEYIRTMAIKLAKKGETLAAVCFTMTGELSDERSRRLYLSLDQRTDESTGPASLDQVIENWEVLSEGARREIVAKVRKELV